MDFTRAQSPMANPYGVRANIILGGTSYGLGHLGAMHPARANTTYVDMVEVTGNTSCLTEVVPWMFSEDDAGVEYDQGSLYGVRTRVLRRPMSDGGGDEEFYVAVPRALIGAYTAVTRCHIGYAQSVDYLGDTPMSGFQWFHRTAAGTFPNPAVGDGLYRSFWSPMNFNQQTLGVSTSWSYMGSVPGHGDYWLSGLTEDHIGFRGGVISAVNPSGSARSGTVELWGFPVNGNWEDNAVQIGSVGVSASAMSTTDAPMPEMLPTADGIRWNYYGIIRPADWTSQLSGVSIGMALSPRTDVPLPWFSSQQNRVAPGGIILP
jgi:hypothetical protein